MTEHKTESAYTEADQRADRAFLVGVAYGRDSERVRAWDEAHDVFCPRGAVCSTHLRSGDRHLLRTRPEE